MGLGGALVDVLGIEVSTPRQPGAEVAEPGVRNEVSEATAGPFGIAGNVVYGEAGPGGDTGDMRELPTQPEHLDDDGAGVGGTHATSFKDQSCTVYRSRHRSQPATR